MKRAVNNTIRGIILPLLIIILILPAIQVPASAATIAGSISGATCTGALVSIAEDGSASVTVKLTAPETAEGNITLSVPGGIIFIQATSNDIVLPVNMSGNTVSIWKPQGVSDVTLQYTTLEIANKTGISWSFSFTSDCPVTLILPSNAVVTSMDPSNPEISVINNTVAFNFPPGSVSAKYYLVSEEAPIGTSPGGTAQGPAGGGTTQASTTQPKGGGASSALLIGGIIAVIVVGAAYWLMKRRAVNPSPAARLQVSELDDRDHSIINALKGNPTGKTASELMRETGIPRTPLYRRLNKLVRLGIIEYYDEGGVRRYRLKTE